MIRGPSPFPHPDSAVGRPMLPDADSGNGSFSELPPIPHFRAVAGHPRIRGNAVYIWSWSRGGCTRAGVPVRISRPGRAR